jgi:methyl-accepting chemotaxis protein
VNINLSDQYGNQSFRGVIMGKISTAIHKFFVSKASGLREKNSELTAEMNALNKVLAVIEFSPEGVILKANQNFLDAVGYSLTEIVGKHHRMFVEPQQAESENYKLFWNKLADGQFDSGQYQRFGKQAKKIWLEASYNPIFDEKGKVYKVVKFATDITVRKLKEVDSAGQLAAINKSQGTIELGLDGRVITANQIFLDVLGYSLNEAVGQHHSTFVSAEYAKSQEYKDFWAKLSQGEFISGRFQRVGKNGKNIWLEASYNPILDVNGKPYKVVKFAADITKQVAIETQAKTLSLVANETSNSVIITDANGLIEYTNSGFTRLTGYTFEEAKGKKPGSFLQGKFTDSETIKRIHSKLESNSSFYDEILNYTREGQPYWISLTIDPVLDANGNLEKYISIQTNINERKLKQIDFDTRLEAISRSSGIIEFTPTGEIIFANENFCNTVGYNLSELKGKHHSALVNPSYKASAEYKQFWINLGNGKFDAGQYSRVAKGGKEIWLQASYNPILNEEGKVIKVVKFATDITEQYNTAETLASAVAETQSVIEEAKSGDISSRVPLDGKTGAIASLCDGVNALMDKMTEVIVQVREAGDTINTAAGEISSGNNDLSQRTEQQASSLEETAASMEELASTVKNNAENAKQANQLAAAASGVAIKGGEVVGQVVNTMSAINSSAKKIEDIISVIDGIAFQTNILALNAAVEAARAGEQGRGFAVVAGEVRNLAQRSAIAAKEIKELIADSVSKTAEGTAQVEQAGKTMQDIVCSVQRVTDIMGEITAASVEQSSGIDQVNQAVTSMDEVTQQNAALVEQAAAAAESLVEQAGSLIEVVSAFKLIGGEFSSVNNTKRRSPVRLVSSKSNTRAFIG